MTLPDHAFWMSAPHLAFLEIAVQKGFRRVVLDIEHNSFAPDQRESLVLAARLMGVQVFAKVEGPDPVSVQRALDLDVAGVIIPHVGSAAEAERICRVTKFPPMGTRSYSAGRTVGFRPPADDWFAAADARITCLPMIETETALLDIEAILACPAVDGVFVGPYDLSLTRGRTGYHFTEADRADIACIADAARAAGKPWWMPAWSAAEQAFCREMGAAVQVVAAEHQVLTLGLDAVIGTVARR